MTYLELCRKLMARAGIAGSLASVTGQNGELLRVVGWVAEAYRAILNLHSDWEFLRAGVQFDVGTSTATYSAAAAGVSEFGEWRFVGDDWRCWNKAIGAADEMPLAFVPYDAFKRNYAYGPQRLMTGRPQVVTELPDESLQFWPKPDMDYTIIGEQYRVPADLAGNEDVPIFRSKFHDVVFYRALMLYAEHEEAGSTFAAAQTECARLVGQMENLYLPAITLGGPMV